MSDHHFLTSILHFPTLLGLSLDADSRIVYNLVQSVLISISIRKNRSGIFLRGGT